MIKYIFNIEENDVDRRIDAYLAEEIIGYSRTYMQKLIDDGAVTINGKMLKSNYKLKLGDEIVVEFPEAIALDIEAENIPLDIVYEDDALIIVNKPQGMVVHPAHGNYEHTMVNALLYHCKNLSGINGVMRPGIVHRIDKNTSGLIMVAKTNEAHLSLSEQLKEHTITRCYTALVEGRLKDEEGTINEPIGRGTEDRKKMMVTQRNSKEAITHYKVLEMFENNTLVEARLETGRTHQIRVHMAYIKHPVVGDSFYGYKKQKFETQGQLLHARVLGFNHPVTGEYMEFSAELPKYFEEVLRKIRR